MKKLTYKGQTKTISEWSKITGIHKSTISGRSASGWPDDKVLATETLDYKTNVSKSDGELWLNDCEELPKCFSKLSIGSNVRKNGQFIRSNFRAEFDKWFDREFCRQVVK